MSALATPYAIQTIGLTKWFGQWLAWLSWLTPFGLLAEAEPYAANRVGPLAAMAVVVSAIAGLALLSAAR